MLGDGSCLFRSFFFHTEIHHFMVRNNLVWLVSLNRKEFRKFVFPELNYTTIEEHIRCMGTPSEWGTYIEIVAATSLFQIPVYYCTESSKGRYTWGMYKPLPAEKLTFPRIVEETFQNRLQISHFKLLYHENKH